MAESTVEKVETPLTPTEASVGFMQRWNGVLLGGLYASMSTIAAIYTGFAVAKGNIEFSIFTGVISAVTFGMSYIESRGQFKEKTIKIKEKISNEEDRIKQR